MDCQYAQNCTPTHTLPFTGLDIAAVILLALVIIAAGIVLRLAAR